jgi:hypothetical protein
VGPVGAQNTQDWTRVPQVRYNAVIMKLTDIVFESSRFYAIQCSYGFDVYQNGHSQAAHGAVRVARIGYKGSAGLERVKAEIARRETEDSPL